MSIVNEGRDGIDEQRERGLGWTGGRGKGSRGVEVDLKVKNAVVSC